MFDKTIAQETVLDLLDFNSKDEFGFFMLKLGRPSLVSSEDSSALTLKETMTLKLASIMLNIGVESNKAYAYSEAVLGTFFAKGWNEFKKLVEEGNQELCCMIEDNQLARIFIRGKDDGREFEVGAVKPVLLPTTRCEINVNRSLRPVLYRAMK